MPNHPELQACLPAAAIIQQAQLAALLIEIKQLVSAPADIYDHIYGTTLNHFIEFCQAMPLDVHTNPPDYSLLTHQLQLVIATLKMRRGLMLPLHTESETIATQEPAWTFAIFAVALLWNLEPLQFNRVVKLYKSHHEEIGRWHPISGSLYDKNTYYKVEMPAKDKLTENSGITTAIAGKIIPIEALRWLGSCSHLLSIWLQALVEQNHKNNILSNLVHKAQQKLTATMQPIERPIHDIKNDDLADKPIITQFTDWIQTSLIKAPSNPPRFLRLPKGILVNSSALSNFDEKHSIPQLIKLLDTFLLKNEKTFTFRYRTKQIENRQIMEGIILAETHLTETLKALPVQTDYMPETFL